MPDETIGVGLDPSDIEEGGRRSERVFTQMERDLLELARAFDRFSSSSTKASTEVDRAIKTIGDTFGSLKSLGRDLTIAVTAPIVGAGYAAVKAASDFDSLKRGLVAVSGSVAEADAQLERLKETAKLPGLSFRDAVEGAIRLQATGLSAQEADRTLRAFGNALATVGKGASDLDGVILALSQIQAKGKISAQEINQLAERLPQIRKVMEQAFGTANTEILQGLGIASKDFIQTIVTEFQKLPAVTGGARNTFENLKDAADRALIPIGDAILRTLIPALETVGPAVEDFGRAFSSLPQSTQTAIVGITAFTALLGPALYLIGGIGQGITTVTTLWGPFVAATTAAATALSGFALTPAGLVILGIAAALGVATAAWLSYESASEAAAKTSDETLRQLAANFKQAQEFRVEVDRLSEAQRAGADTTSRLADAISRLPSSVQATIKGFKDVDTQVRLVGDAARELSDQAFGLLAPQLLNIGQAAGEQAKRLEELRARQAELRRDFELFSKGELFPVEKYGNDISNIIQDLGRVSSELGSTEEAFKRSGRQLFELGAAFGQNAGKLEAFLRSVGNTPQAVQAAMKAYFDYERAQTAAASATAQGTEAFNQQAAAIANVAKSLADLDVAGARSGLKAVLSQKAAAGFAAGKSTRDIISEISGNETITSQARQIRETESVIDAVIGKFLPGKSGGGRSRSGSNDLERVLREEIDRRRAQREQLIAIEEAGLDVQRAKIESHYAQRLTYAEQYYEALRRLQTEQTKLTVIELGRQVREELSLQTQLRDPKAIRSSQTRVEELGAQIQKENAKLGADLAKSAVDEARARAAALPPARELADTLRLVRDHTRSAWEAEVARNNAVKEGASSRISDQRLQAEAELQRNLDVIERDREARRINEETASARIANTTREYAGILITVLEQQLKVTTELRQQLDIERELARLRDIVGTRPRVVGKDVTIPEPRQRTGGEKFVDALKKQQADLIPSSQEMADQFASVWYRTFRSVFEEGPKGFFKNLGELFGQMLADLAARLLTSLFLRLFTQLFGGFLGGIGGPFNSAGSSLGGGLANLGGRATGGPVSPGVPYWVGERREKELFVPATAGTVYTADQVRGGGGDNITVNINAGGGGLRSRDARAEQLAQIDQGITRAQSRRG